MLGLKQSLKEQQEERNWFDYFLNEFGIDKNARCHPDSSLYKGHILTVDEILQKLRKVGLIGKPFLGIIKGWLFILVHSHWLLLYKDPSSYYAGYWFRLIDKNPDRYQLTWEQY